MTDFTDIEIVESKPKAEYSNQERRAVLYHKLQNGETLASLEQQRLELAKTYDVSPVEIGRDIQQLRETVNG